MQSKPIKKLFVCEFITGGGFNHDDLPSELVEQGQLMRDALLHDLSHMPYHISTTVDARLIPPADCNSCLTILAGYDVWRIWEEAIAVVDAVWLIAPETQGYLARLTQLAMKHKKELIGSGLNAVTTCSSKLASYQLFIQAGVLTVNTLLFHEWPKTSSVKWLAKPDDGAGCEETVCFEIAEDLERWMILNDKMETHVIQPYLLGEAASISCVMYAGKAYVLSCNKQLISLRNNTVSYEGCLVNGMCLYWDAFERVANKIAQLLPDLAGYVGIDVIVSDTYAKKITVIEVNPRLTTSYIGLFEATGHNPAELVMNMLTQESYVWPALEKNEVLLELNAHHV